MFFKKKDDSDVDVLEKIKEKIAEDNEKKEQKLSGNDEAFLEDVLSEKDLDEINESSDGYNKKNENEQIFNDINKIADEAISKNEDEQEKFEDSINDDDLLDELDDYEDDEGEKDDNYDDNVDIEEDDLNLPSNDKDNELPDRGMENKSINSSENLEKGNNINVNNIQFSNTENDNIKKQSFKQDKTENSNNIKLENVAQNTTIGVSKKTKNNVRGHITELIEDVKNQILEKKSPIARQSFDGNKTITQLVTEIAQPVIIKYLDDNLERIVKNAVNNEIKKIVSNINNND